MITSIYNSIKNSENIEKMFQYNEFYYVLTVKVLPHVVPLTNYLFKIEALGDLISHLITTGEKWTEDKFVNVFFHENDTFVLKTLAMQFEVYHGTPSTFVFWEDLSFSYEEEPTVLTNLLLFNSYLKRDLNDGRD